MPQPSWVFNRRLPQVTPVLLGDIEYPDTNWKYAPVALVRANTTDTVRRILDAVPLVGNAKRILVDVKVQHLVPDKTSCIPGWHVDGTGNPFDDGENEFHHLCVVGNAPTEFVREPIYVDKKVSVKELPNVVPSDAGIYKVREGVINTYTSFDFHRGVHAPYPLTRLLVRVTETDKVIPSTKPFTPSTER